MPVVPLLALALLADPIAVSPAADGSLHLTLAPAPGETATLDLAPRFGGAPAASATVSTVRDVLALDLRRGGQTAKVQLRRRDDGCSLRVSGPRGFSLLGKVASSAGALYAARVVLDDAGQPTPHGAGEVLDIAVGRAANRRCNAVYTTETFRGVLLDGDQGTVDLQPIATGYRFRVEPGTLDLRTLDVWPILGWRPADGGSTYGHPDSSQPHVVPREWMQGHRPFPWQTFSPVQLPFISITDPKDFARVQEQVDYLAENLRDWGFYCFGEWPLTQHNPEYAPPAAWRAYLAGNQRTCDYAHSKGIKILRWVTDPDIEPHGYPALYAEMKAKGWLSLEPNPQEWLPDYTNPDVQKWIEQVYAELGATGPDFYWIDNNHPTRPLHDPDRFPPEAFREYYRAIQRGLLSTGRNDILIRSGASEWADYSAAGILDVYAPGPDVQNDWTEQQIYVAGTMASSDYLCHFNLWRRCIDDFFPAGPQTLDQTRAMATLLGLSGIGFTTTDIGFPKLPPERLDLLRKLVPIAVTRPIDLYRFPSIPHWWVQTRQDEERTWQVAGVFNWGLRSEETQFMPLEGLGLDPTKEYLVYDFWSQQPVGRFRGAIGLRVAPTTGRALAIHPIGDRPFIVATDRHVTMGAAELANVHWDGNARTLSGEFVAGVKGQTFHLTVFAPERWQPAGATVAGEPVTLRLLTDGERLYDVAVPCSGAEEPFAVTFEPALPATARPAPREVVPGAVDLGAAGVLGRVTETDLAALVRKARAGEIGLLTSPTTWSPELAGLQAKVGVRWGLHRPAEPGAEWRLVPDAGLSEAPDDLLYRATCIGFQPNRAAVIVKRMGPGALVILPPTDSVELRHELEDQGGLPPQLAASGAEMQAHTEAGATATVGAFEINAERTAGTAPLHVPWGLIERRLSFHFRRLSMSVLDNVWGVPRVTLLLNGTELPHLYNPCRPESPPQEWDSLYFEIPAGLVRGEGKDEVTVRSAIAAKDPAALAADLHAGLELCVEDAAVAGRTTLVSPPLVALTAPDGLDALLGLDGGARYLNQSGDLGVTWEGGTPYNGWPLARPGGVSHCLFSTTGFALKVKVPRATRGTLEVFAYDYEGVRTEDVTFEAGKPVTVEQFADGKWLRFPFTETDTRDGELRVTVSNPRGGNAVLSRVRLKLE
ncbi:MAG: hypothetical protein HYU66_15445 [Armatimonadetes bacterium]|nr:hypothetical protein [Armatimonadota bacterium]